MDDRERIQRLVARTIATSAAGNQLCLIGGFRYRLLDRSARISQDIDYHFAGDLAERQTALLALMNGRLLSDVHRQLGYQGDARLGAPGDESDWLRSIHLAFWKENVPASRIEIPVELVRIQCHDRPVVKTMEGTVYLTASDADMVESKVVSLFGRTVVEHRDLVDLFLFAGSLLPESGERLAAKLASAGVASGRIEERLASFREGRRYHVGAIDRVLQDQLDRPTADALQSAGGGEMVLGEVLQVIERLRIGGGGK